MKIGPIYKTLIKENNSKIKTLKEIGLLLEKEIKVGDTLTKKLSSIKKNDLAQKILTFLNSNQIKDNVDVEYVDYNKKHGKLITLGYNDRDGNSRERQFKISKLISYLGGNLNDIKSYEMEDVINHLKQGDVENLKLFKGDDILKIYHCENYDEGETMGSCMRYESAQAYLSIYTDNPNQVQVLALINPENGKVRGRALIWTLDDGSKFMDRVYTTNKQYDVEFNNYSEENNISRRNPSSDITLEVDGEYEYYPYMDTFDYYEPDTGTLSANNYGGDWKHLQDTHGGDNTGMYSDIHGETIPEDQAAYVDHIEDWVYDHEVVMSWDGKEYLYKDSDNVYNITVGEYEGSYALKDDVVKLYDGEIGLYDDAYPIDFGEHEGEYGLGDDLVYTVDGEHSLFEDSVQLSAGQHDGDYTNPDNVYVLLSGDDDGETIHYDDLTDYDGEKWVEYNNADKS